MRAVVQSSHVAGDFSGGELSLTLERSSEDWPSPRRGRVSFSVPPDFHVHNDCVAAAAMTLIGRTRGSVTFDFAISERCAGLLSSYYRLEEVGPVDPDLEPRRPGRFLGINFSGGTDSTALYLILREAIGETFKVITCDFGDGFPLERIGYEAFRRDVTCRTDLRKKRLDRAGRFIASVPLLYADYLDLHSVASGHVLLQDNVTFESTRDGHRPNYREKDPVYQAGGLEEAHLIRGLFTPGVFKIIIDLAPDRMEAAFAASGRRETEKYYSRAVWIREIYRREGLPLPEFLRSLAMPAIRWPHNPGQRYSLFVPWAVKYEGIEAARPVLDEIDHFDFSYLDDLSLRFMTGYNTNVVHLLPDDVRQPLLRAFHQHGIFPYSERDWQELDIVRREIFEPGGPA